jgi:hypothetical protein
MGIKKIKATAVISHSAGVFVRRYIFANGG